MPGPNEPHLTWGGAQAAAALPGGAREGQGASRASRGGPDTLLGPVVCGRGGECSEWLAPLSPPPSSPAIAPDPPAPHATLGPAAAWLSSRSSRRLPIGGAQPLSRSPLAHAQCHGSYVCSDCTPPQSVTPLGRALQPAGNSPASSCRRTGSRRFRQRTRKGDRMGGRSGTAHVCGGSQQGAAWPHVGWGENGVPDSQQPFFDRPT